MSVGLLRRVIICGPCKRGRIKGSSGRKIKKREREREREKEKRKKWSSKGGGRDYPDQSGHEL